MKSMNVQQETIDYSRSTINSNYDQQARRRRRHNVVNAFLVSVSRNNINLESTLNAIKKISNVNTSDLAIIHFCTLCFLYKLNRLFEWIDW